MWTGRNTDSFFAKFALIMELIQLDCAGVALGSFYRRLQFLFMYGRPPLLNVFTYLIKSISYFEKQSTITYRGWTLTQKEVMVSGLKRDEISS